MTKQLTPQEKKKLSYERDRRNCFGESPHAARKSIPLRKALRNRANRRQQEQPLHRLEGVSDMELAEEVESAMQHRAPKGWKKIADAPLGKVVSGRLEDREAMRAQGGRRALRTIRYANDQDW